VQRKENGLEAGATRMKAIVMRQTKTLPLITLIERIFADRERLVVKQENVPESVCDGTKKSVIGKSKS
jgi:hypothetical protein